MGELSLQVVSVAVLAGCSPWGWRQANSPGLSLVVAGWTAFGLLSLALGYVPLRLGMRRVAHLEL
jgi:hypothetical protein